MLRCGPHRMYSATDDSFVDVQMVSEGCSQLTVSFDGEEILKFVR